MLDPLTLLWPQMEAPRPLFSHEMVQRWSIGALDRLQAIGLLKLAETAARVVCPGCCEGHIEDVVAIIQPDGSCRFFVYCPEVWRAEVSRDSLQQWTIDFESLAGVLGRSMSLKGKCMALAPGRLWRLGKTLWQGALRDVLLARGLAWKDGPEVVRRIGRSRRPIVLVGKRAPPNEIWKDCRPAVVPLAEVAALEEDRVAIDAVVLAAMVADADMDWADDRSPLLDERRLRRLIRVHRDCELKDDVLVAAYKQYGSYRKAAAALVAQGAKTDRWAISRAVQRAGGVAALRRNESSSSVVRIRASQRHGGRRCIRIATAPLEG